MRALLIIVGLVAALPAWSTSFVFRGELQDGGVPAQGLHALRLTLYSHENSTVPLAGPVELPAVMVDAGRFAVDVDFGALPASLGEGWLEVAVRVGEDPFAALDGREPVALKATGVCPAAWALAGNADTDVAVDFLGTTTAQPLQLRANNQRVAQFESVPLDTGSTVNVLLGSASNAIDAGRRGAVIGGGGAAVGSDVQFTEVGPNLGFSSYSTVGGGLRNRAGNTADAGPFATIGGGHDNVASGTASFVGGGYTNDASATYATIGGGHLNDASGTNATIGGGVANEASGATTTIGGGSENEATQSRATVAGGAFNRATADFATVGGGGNNSATGAIATVGGGGGNAATGAFATVSGGSGNCAGGEGSWAGGTNGRVRVSSTTTSVGGCSSSNDSGDADGDEGTFLWADAQGAPFISKGPNQFAIRAIGGVRLNTDTDLFFGLQTRQMINLYDDTYGIGVQSGTMYFRSNERFAWFDEGVHDDDMIDPGPGGALLMTLGATTGTPTGTVRAQTFTPVSSRHVKTGLASVDVSSILARVIDLPLSEWSYIDKPQMRHIGPMSQDFHAAFGLNGADDESIATVDADGVMLAAIQGLNAKLENELAALRAEVSALRRELGER